ncbi:unnamed protein product, partial [Notodromas monacha]
HSKTSFSFCSYLSLQCLQHLDLSSLHHLSPQLLIESIQCFPELITLNLSKTSAVNQVCATVGKYCPNIVDLDISYSEITDKGVLDLVHLQCGRQAQRMHRLNVLGLKLNHGTVTFILQNLPNLQVLEEENLFAAFRGLRGKKLSVAARKSTALEYLQPEHVALKTLVSCVQELQPMDILTAIQISPLATKCLQHLDLSSLHHLSPQLLIESIQCFPELITLNLSKTSAVNQVCATVGKYCPNIVDLDISYSEITDKGVLDLAFRGLRGKKLSVAARKSTALEYLQPEH